MQNVNAMKRAVQMTMPVIKQLVSVLVSLDGMAINVNKVNLETATQDEYLPQKLSPKCC